VALSDRLTNYYREARQRARRKSAGAARRRPSMLLGLEGE
jgi:hypothetical protein